MSVIKVMICDDHPLISEGLQKFITEREKMEIVAIAASKAELMENLKKSVADVLLLDINLPDGHGIEICSLVKQEYPDIKIIGLSNFGEQNVILQMVNSGASGYLVKSTPVSEIESAIREVSRGGVFFGPEAQLAMSSFYRNKDDVPPLTKREKEVLDHLSKGLTSAEIGEKMFVSSQTVDSHRKSLMKKFKVNKTVNLLDKAKELNIIL